MLLFIYYLLVVIDCLLFSYLFVSALTVLHELVIYSNELRNELNNRTVLVEV